MKKITTILALLCMALTSQAFTVTIADFNNSPENYGTLTNNYKFTTNAASGVAGVNLQATNSDVTIGYYDLSSNSYPYGKGIKLVTNDANSHTLTLTAPEGYVITGYSIGASANSSSYKHTLTAADESTSVTITSLGNNNNKFQYLTVSGLSSNSTTFTIQTQNGGNTLYIAYFTITLSKYTSSITSGKYYRLHSVAYDNKTIRELSSELITEAPSDNTYSQIWKITSRGTGYSLQNAATGKYIQGVSTSSEQFKTNSSAVTFYSGKRTVNNRTQFWFSTQNSTSSYTALHCAATQAYNVVSWYATNSGTTEDASYWFLEEVEVDENIIASLQAQSTLTTGYYRLTNASYSDRSMADGGGYVQTPTTLESSYTQIWKLAISGSTCTLQNALTEKYIQSNTSASAQYKTGTSPFSFNIIPKESDGKFLFSFQNPSSNWFGLHSAATQSYNVVGWNYADDPSYWILTKVDVDETELQNLRNSLNVDYTTQLATFFSDAACTTLKSAYQNYSDANLRSAMSSLPTELQDMAIRVKNDKWNANTTFNSYEKRFRIHSYEIFSNSDLWKAKTGTGPFAHLFHPTGIQAKAGDIVYLFVSNDLKDSDASLEAECVAGTDRKGAAYTLKKGFNAIYVPYESEIFVSYLLNNTDKSCNDYPKITVHIEGGTCNGCFDMRGHGHKNSDWEWLKNNMFKNTYLHVKGNSTLLNCLRERIVDTSNTQNVEGIMGIWDYVFDTEESLCGTDKWKSTGHYKMMVNNYDNEAGGNPFWGNNYGYSQPGIYKDKIFNYSTLSNVDIDGGQIWVIEHELGHGHQGPINLSGQTESSNNSLAQAVNFLTVQSGLFSTNRSSRGEGVNAMIARFNQDGGYSWIDYGGMRTKNGNYDDLWISNRWLFQLWLYFDGMKKYKPTENQGYSFMSDLYDAMRADPLVKSSSSSSPANATDDYLKLAKKCAELTQTDLSEFFEAWGFWKLEPTVANDNDIPDSKIWYFGDYTNTYVKTSQTMVDNVRNYMKSLPNKAGGLMFIEDRCTGSTLPTYNGEGVSTFGELGYYGNFDKAITGTYKAEYSGTKVTISGGSNAVGFKVRDEDGNIVALANTNEFTVTTNIINKLKDGTYTISAAQGTGEDADVITTKDYANDVYYNIFLTYFTQNVGKYFGISQQCYDAWNETVQVRMLRCSEQQYNELQQAVEDGILYPETGEYRIKSSGTRNIGESYIGYGSPRTNGKSDGLITVAAANAKEDPTTVLTLTKTGTKGMYYIQTNGLYVQNQTTNNQPFPATSTAPGAAFTFVIQSPGVVAISNDMTEQGYFHEANDAQGWTIPGVVRWKASEEPSHWTVEDAWEQGDVNHDGYVNISDVNILMNIILGKAESNKQADVNGDNNITIADITTLVNLILGK